MEKVIILLVILFILVLTFYNVKDTTIGPSQSNDNKTGSVEQIELIIKYLKKPKILNFGSGDGIITQYLRKRNYDVTDIDIEDNNVINSKPTLYDGVNIPFNDKTFDYTICFYVLHHTTNHIQLLNEMKRVTKNLIIVSEDIPETCIDYLLCQCHGNICSSWNSGGFLFNTDETWRDIFKNINLNLIDTIPLDRINKYTRIYYPVKRYIYILSIDSNQNNIEDYSL